MSVREFLREMLRPTPVERSFGYRSMWRRHPVFSALYVAVAVALTALSLLDLVEGRSQLRSGLYAFFWFAWIALLIAWIRRDEPPPEQ